MKIVGAGPRSVRSVPKSDALKSEKICRSRTTTEGWAASALSRQAQGIQNRESVLDVGLREFRDIPALDARQFP